MNKYLQGKNIEVQILIHKYYSKNIDHLLYLSNYKLIEIRNKPPKNFYSFDVIPVFICVYVSFLYIIYFYKSVPSPLIVWFFLDKNAIPVSKIWGVHFTPGS